MTREYTATGDRNYAIRVCSDDEAEAWDEALRQEGVERERARILAAVKALTPVYMDTWSQGQVVFVPLATVIAAIKDEA